MKPLRSVDIETMQEAAAAIERSDVCAVPAAAVVAEAMVALVLADALVERYGGDTMTDLHRSVDAAAAGLRARFQPRCSARFSATERHRSTSPRARSPLSTTTFVAW
jgi:chorismate synthase